MIEELIEIYILSSVPNYLYRRYLETDYVIYLIENKSLKELIRKYKKFYKTKSNSLRNVVMLYAYLIAIIEVTNNLPDLEINKLKWGEYLINNGKHS